MKSQIIEDLYKKTRRLLMTKDEKINLLEKELTKYQSGYLSGAMLNEIRALYSTGGGGFIYQSLIKFCKSQITRYQ
ncbi:MAG: hypothetical protein MZV64_24450 [Ignavibacteriales bacterium]|nr:hypothetical protein [Ignavibacteriales bacterium]